MALKRLGHKAREPVMFDSELVERLADTGAGMEDEFNDRLRAMDDCVAELKLSGVSREVFSMRYGDGLPPREIGKAMGIEAGTVRVMLNRIREAIRTCVEKKLKREYPIS